MQRPTLQLGLYHKFVIYLSLTAQYTLTALSSVAPIIIITSLGILLRFIKSAAQIAGYIMHTHISSVYKCVYAYIYVCIRVCNYACISSIIHIIHSFLEILYLDYYQQAIIGASRPFCSFIRPSLHPSVCLPVGLCVCLAVYLSR